jgi:hypothetical protein
LTPIIDIHTHCSPRVAGDPFGVAARTMSFDSAAVTAL